MRAALLCLVASAALAQDVPTTRPADRIADCMRIDRRDRLCASDPSLLRILPASGAGSPTMNTDLCTAFASEMTGNLAWCEQAGGTVSGLPLSTGGTLPTATPRVCPNGPDCSAINVWDDSGATGYRKTATTAAPTGDLSCFAVARVTDATANVNVMSRQAGGADGFYVTAVTNGNVSVSIGGTSATYSGGGATPGAWNLFAFTYSRVGAGTSVAKVYANGSSGVGTSSVMPLLPATAGIYFMSGGDSQTVASKVQIAVSGCTEKVLSAATIDAMAATALGSFTGTRGETISFTRASTKTCVASDGSLTVLPNNRPCIGAAKGLLVEGSNTNLALYSRDLSNAVWTKTSTTATLTDTGMTGVASSASRLTATGANGTVTQALTVAAATRTTSFGIKRVTGTGNVDLTRDNGGTWTTLTSAQCFDPGTFAATAINSSTFVRCYVTSSVLNPTIGLRLVTSGDAVTVDFAQDEDSAFVTSAIPTTGTSATRAADVPTVVGLPAGFSLAGPGCAGARSFTPSGVTISNNSAVATTSGLPYYFQSATTLGIYDGTSSPVPVVADVRNRSVDGRGYWSGASKSVGEIGSAVSSDAFDGTLGAGTTIYLGHGNGAGGYLNGYLSNIRLGASTTSCDR